MMRKEVSHQGRDVRKKVNLKELDEKVRERRSRNSMETLWTGRKR